MKRFFAVLFLLILDLLTFANPSFNSVFNENKNSDDKSGEKLTVLAKWFMPETLKEISGICWIDEKRIACVQDEIGVIYIYNLLNAKVENQIQFAGTGDYESITQANGVYYVLRSDGIIFEIKTNNQKNPMVKQFENPLDKNLDFEGIFYDKNTNRLLISFKQSDPRTSTKTKGIYAFDLISKMVGKQAIFEIDLTNELINKQKDKSDENEKDLYKNFQPSDIAINPVTSDIYVTDGVNSSILIMDKKGKIKSSFKLDKDDFPQPEGITFSSKGELFISSEGVKYAGIIARVQIEQVIQTNKKKKD